VTFHGPGQIVGYPILDLSQHYQDLHRYLRDLEETVLRTIGTFGIQGERDGAYTGVWVGGEKIAAIGVKVKRWVTMHGFALNVNTDLSYFDSIIPCGIFHKGVTSMKQLLGREADFGCVREELLRQFAGVFSAGVQITRKDYFLNHIASLASEQNEWNAPAKLPLIS
jgi:lipoate-protein ligase B